jgi:hypothetical protein
MQQHRNEGRPVNTEIRQLQSQVRRLSVAVAVLAGTVVVFGLSAFRSEQVPSVLRACGLIIEDASGHERILIGAPIPFARSRVRTDPDRVARVWGPGFPKEYLEYYKSYRHDMTGILVLDSTGFDRVAVGENLPDPNIGRRIAPSTGMVINDRAGFERSGYGLLAVGGQDRVVLGLDNATGEAVTLFVDNGGRAGVWARDSSRTLFLGGAPAKDELTGEAEPFFGLLVRDGARAIHRLRADRPRR